MDLYQAMSTQRAVRRLRPDPIPEDVLQRVLQAATWAPSGGNVQPWRLVLVRDAAQKRALETLYAPLWSQYIERNRERLQASWNEAEAGMRRTIAAGDYLASHMHEAPAIAVFCFNPSLMAITDRGQARPSVVGGGSVYPAVQNFMLACRAEGVGCVLTTLLCMVEPEVKALLEMPDDWFTCAYVPIGYPVGKGYGSISRRAVDEMVYTDRWPG